MYPGASMRTFATADVQIRHTLAPPRPHPRLVRPLVLKISHSPEPPTLEWSLPGYRTFFLCGGNEKGEKKAFVSELYGKLLNVTGYRKVPNEGERG